MSNIPYHGVVVKFAGPATEADTPPTAGSPTGVPGAVGPGLLRDPAGRARVRGGPRSASPAHLTSTYHGCDRSPSNTSSAAVSRLLRIAREQGLLLRPRQLLQRPLRLPRSRVRPIRPLIHHRHRSPPPHILRPAAGVMELQAALKIARRAGIVRPIGALDDVDPVTSLPLPQASSC